MSPLALSAQPSPSSHLPPVPLPPPDSSVEKPGLVQCRSVFTGQPASSARTPLQCVPRSGLLSRVCEFVTSQRLFCGVWYRGERNIGKMTCTILLVTLMMVCTVSFIYGTQSDSVLKEVLSATGNSPRLHKTRDGSDKYGRFRKALVRKSRNDYTADPPATPLPPPKPCTNDRQVCGVVTRVNRQRTWFTGKCKCDDSLPRGCSQAWESDSLTSTDTSNYDIEYQRKFCVELPQVDNCIGNLVGKTAGILTSTITSIGAKVMVYTPTCKCPNNKVFLYEVNKTNNTVTFVCDKSFAFRDGICARRYFERGGQKVDVITYPYICDKLLSYPKCPEPEKGGDIWTDQNGKSTVSRCTERGI